MQQSHAIERERETESKELEKQLIPDQQPEQVRVRRMYVVGVLAVRGTLVAILSRTQGRVRLEHPTV